MRVRMFYGMYCSGDERSSKSDQQDLHEALDDLSCHMKLDGGRARRVTGERRRLTSTWTVVDVCVEKIGIACRSSEHAQRIVHKPEVVKPGIYGPSSPYRPTRVVG
jgi:hypothetical protein